jgi:hypothetical protein
MRTSTLKVVIGDVTYHVDDPKLGDGLKATVSVVKEGEPLARILHRHRFNLSRCATACSTSWPPSRHRVTSRRPKSTPRCMRRRRPC